jgi:hypothetical protein
MPYYLNPNINGIISANSDFNGTSITLKWAQAYPFISTSKIAYNIYMSAESGPDFTADFFNQSPTFISLDGYTAGTITDLTPGHMYHFAVRACEYSSSVFNLSTLPVVSANLRMLPSSLLNFSLTKIGTTIHLLDAEGFPSAGTVRIGTELIQYSSVSVNDLIVAQRGVGAVPAREHLVDGYDGYVSWDPAAILWPFTTEEQNTRVFECQARFDRPHYPYLDTDGYHQKIADLLNTDMTVSDVINASFPPYDLSGYHRTPPNLILSGKCIGSYIGGVRGCADGYGGTVMVKGVGVIAQNQQRQELQLDNVGEPAILMKRQWTGITCSCYIPSQEYPEARCNKCFGSGFEVGYQQYFNPRRSDKKIMVRFDPTVETVDPTESGLESNSKPNCWTRTVPTLHERDFLVRFDQAGNEEFRYEVLNVTRNKFVLDAVGLQKFTLQRIRKTDIIYMVPVIEDVATNQDGTPGINTFRILSTNIAMSPGFAPHVHTLQANSNIISATQLNGITSVVQGHSHTYRNGIITSGSEIPGEEGIGHTHNIIFSPP